MAAKVKEKKKFTFVQAQIIIFTILGFGIGAFLSYFYFTGLFEGFMSQRLKFIEQDWSWVEYSANRLADQVIALKKLLTQDKIKKVDYEHFDRAIDIRSRIIGGDQLGDKVPLLKEFEQEINKVIEYYDSRMDLRKKRFSYIEWGNMTQEYIKEYEPTKPVYNDDADDFNGKLKIFPYNYIPFWSSNKTKYKVLPLTEEGKITPVQTATEKYFHPLPGAPREVVGEVPGEKAPPDEEIKMKK